MKISKPILLLIVIFTIGTSTLLGGKTYILCEGNFGQANASLWSIDEDLQSVQGPLIWNTSTNPMGDVGQSMTLFEDYLYIVMNGSHEVRIVEIGETEEHIGDIELPGASPRYMAVDEVARRGYISSWTLGGLIVVDMDTHALIDTFYTQSLPEQILIIDQDLYVTIPMEGDWTATNQVLKISTANNELAITDVYRVIEGPGAIMYYDNRIYVASIHYNDAWETFTGTSFINEMDGTVVTLDHGNYINYTADFDMLGQSDAVYRTYGNSLVPLRADLSLDTDNAIGNISGIYTHLASQLADALFIGSTDFVAPDLVTVLSYDGQTELGTFNVGALPSDIVYHHTPPVSTSDLPSLPETFSLGSNYPNPFNPATTIPFKLDHREQVSMNVFDLQGLKVKSLLEGAHKAGEHQVSWDGKDDQGSPVSSGLYLVALKTADKTEQIKVTLLR